MFKTGMHAVLDHTYKHVVFALLFCLILSLFYGHQLFTGIFVFISVVSIFVPLKLILRSQQEKKLMLRGEGTCPSCKKNKVIKGTDWFLACSEKLEEEISTVE